MHQCTHDSLRTRDLGWFGATLDGHLTTYILIIRTHSWLVARSTDLVTWMDRWVTSRWWYHVAQEFVWGTSGFLLYWTGFEHWHNISESDWVVFALIWLTRYRHIIPRRMVALLRGFLLPLRASCHLPAFLTWTFRWCKSHFSPSYTQCTQYANTQTWSARELCANLISDDTRWPGGSS